MTDRSAAQILGRVLQTGVLLAAAVALLGGALFLLRHGAEPADHRVFHGEPEGLRAISGIVHGALVQGQARAIIQLGLLILIATPVARVALSVYAFAREEDRLYVGITLLVLLLLVAGLFL